MKTFYTLCAALWLSCSLLTTARAVTLDEARGYIQAGDYAAALHAFRTLMTNKTYAQRADCNKWFGESLCMTGSYAEALPYLEYAAKRQVKGAYWYLALCRQKQYDFEGAIKVANQYRTAMKSSPLWVQRVDSLLEELDADQRAVERVRRVVIIDSMTVSRDQFFRHYHTGSESGRLLPASECGGEFETAAQGVVFESQAGTYRLWVPESNDRHIYESHLISGAWEPSRPLSGLEVDGARLAYPYLRSDGESLYFAQLGTSGLGGWDLYRTHYDSESEAYYTPERLPMPFNSPEDDYLMAIDETHQVGWWATSRHATPEFVTLYLYLLEEEPAYLVGEQISRARIDNIRDTWTVTEGYADLVAELMSDEPAPVTTGALHIVINDHVVYSSVDDFRSEDARRLYERAQEVLAQLQEVRDALTQARDEWRTADAAQRRTLQPRMLQAEQSLLALQRQYEQLQRSYRNLENIALS